MNYLMAVPKADLFRRLRRLARTEEISVGDLEYTEVLVDGEEVRAWDSPSHKESAEWHAIAQELRERGTSVALDCETRKLVVAPAIA